MSKNIKIFIVDDHTIVRFGIKAFLSSFGNFSIVGEAIDGETAIQKIKVLNPDIIISDIILPGLNGIDLLKIIKKDFPKIKVIMFSMIEDIEIINKAIEAGANGFLIKINELTELLTAIEYVESGRTFFSERVSYLIVNELKQNNPFSIDSSNEYFRLSDREKEVLSLIVHGNSNKMISSELKISVHTVAIHRTNLMKKLGAKNVADLVSKAIKQSII